MEETVYYLIEGMADPKRIKRASLLQLAKALALITDKKQLLRGNASALLKCPECGRLHRRPTLRRGSG